MRIFWDKIPKCFTHVERKSPGFVIAYMEHPSDYGGYEFSGFEDRRYLIEGEEYELEDEDGEYVEEIVGRPGITPYKLNKGR